MFRIEQEMKDRYCSILLQGIPVVEIKVTEVTDDEVIGKYDDETLIRINHSFIMAYWPDKAKDLRERKRMEAKKKKSTQD